MDIEAIGDPEMYLDKPPKFGLKLRLDHKFPLRSKQAIKLKPKQVFDMMPLVTSTVILITEQAKAAIHIIPGCPIGGIGGGTIGRGYKGEFCRFQLYPGIYEYVTIPECQFIVNIRNNKNETIYQSVLSTYRKPKKAPATWQWNLNSSDCEYTALYPRAWTTYDLSQYGVKLVCRQISPVIPHNYKDSSLPCAVFVFSALNVCDEHRDVSITFTWTEVLGGPNKKKILVDKLDVERYSNEYSCGVTLEQKIADMTCSFTIAKRKCENETIHEGYCLWNSLKTSSYIWECLKENGKLLPDPKLTPPSPTFEESTEKINTEKEKIFKIYKCDSIGLSSCLSLDPGGIQTTEFSLVWDMPIIKYKKDKKIYKRYYTKYFGGDGIAGASIGSYALRNYENWEKQIAEWQDPILSNVNIPEWLKSALMNELYFVADGGTIWYDVRDEYPETDPRHEFGIFGYLEGHEYRMYNTYDVHFYASFALAQLWPNLQVVLQYMFRDTIAIETVKCRKSLYNGKIIKFKIKDTIPHDLGDPDDVPLTNINVYNIHDVSEWRDLNLKFILQVSRDYRLLLGHCAPFSDERYRLMAYIDDVRDGTEDDLYSRATGQAEENLASIELSTVTVEPPRVARNILDLLYSGEMVEEAEWYEQPLEEIGAASPVWDARTYLADMYPSCVALLRKARHWDTDGDGLIENGGFPDQTYDAWVMTGPSAYCGGLWVASISAVRNMARILGFEEDEKEFSNLLENARKSYEEKLWSGTYYRFDTRRSNHNVVMADQLAGHWFLRASGITDKIFPEVNVKKALQCIFDNNVLRFAGGKMGAVNGYVATGRGHIDTTALQSSEVWTGVTYGLAALMIYEGMHDQAFVTAGGMYNTMTQMGLSFETPEALYENGNHRSIGYMRPLAIWAMYQAIMARPQTPVTLANGQLHHAKNRRL